MFMENNIQLRLQDQKPLKKGIITTGKKSLNQFYKTFNGVKSGDDVLIYKRLHLDHPYYNGDIYPKVQCLLLKLIRNIMIELL